MRATTLAQVLLWMLLQTYLKGLATGRPVILLLMTRGKWGNKEESAPEKMSMEERG